MSEQQAEPIAYRIPWPLIAPGLLMLASLAYAYTVDLSMLFGLPFVLLGAYCAAPNHNLADGFLALLACGLGFALHSFHRELGISAKVGGTIVLPTLFSWYLGGLELRIRAKPVYAEEEHPG